MKQKKILVLCTGNSCRSQIAEAYLRLFAADKAEIYSAGVAIHGLNPQAVQIMKEVGLDISHHSSNHVDEYQHIRFDIVITVCDHAQETCPLYHTNALRLHHNFADPSKVQGSVEQVHQAFVAAREQIKAYCSQIVSDYL